MARQSLPRHGHARARWSIPYSSARTPCENSSIWLQATRCKSGDDPTQASRNRLKPAGLGEFCDFQGLLVRLGCEASALHAERDDVRLLHLGGRLCEGVEHVLPDDGGHCWHRDNLATWSEERGGVDVGQRLLGQRADVPLVPGHAQYVRRGRALIGRGEVDRVQLLELERLVGEWAPDDPIGLVQARLGLRRELRHPETGVGGMRALIIEQSAAHHRPHRSLRCARSGRLPRRQVRFG
mmetsp:Transcript_17464/g.57213  ORF Transcript_17464/g.57213 Transcript_17464/m.57213 type:complete len:239 (-) Transcript_17464:485-1201(-)